MNSYLSDLENIIINAQSGGQSLSFALKPCATEKSVFDKEVNITPLWLIRKQEAERKAKEETEHTRLQQEAERKAKELAEERIRRGTAEPVDLGLSVLWASHNIGARSSEQPGIYAAWTSKKEAINMWGEDWRLPTQQEMTELMQNCQWTWTVINGMPGFQILAANGNNSMRYSIFLFEIMFSLLFVNVFWSVFLYHEVVDDKVLSLHSVLAHVVFQ